MGKSRCITIIILFFLIVIFPGCDSEGNTKGPPSPGHSGSINESKQKGVFQYEVSPDKSVLCFDSSCEIKIENAWVENRWSHENYIIGKAPVEKSDNSYQLIMTLRFDTGDHNGHFYFIGSKPLDYLIYYNCKNYYSDRIDTIKVPIYREMAPILPSRKERKAFDTITFIKRPGKS